jgi:hypothetical protein
MLTKKEQRLRRARQTRIRIATQGVARLTVNRTNLHIYATVISGDGAKVLASASTAEAEMSQELGASGKGGNTAAAQPRPPASRRWRLTARVLPTTAASRLWPTRPAKPACSSKDTDTHHGKSFKPRCKTTVPTTVCAKR